MLCYGVECFGREENPRVNCYRGDGHSRGRRPYLISTDLDRVETTALMVGCGNMAIDPT